MEIKNITAVELTAIRVLDDSNLIVLLSDIHDHGWESARRLLPYMATAKEVLSGYQKLESGTHANENP